MTSEKDIGASSSSEGELYELPRQSYPSIPRNFEERRLFDMENPREIQGKLRLPVDAFNFNMPADFERAAERLKFTFVTHVDFE